MAAISSSASSFSMRWRGMLDALRLALAPGGDGAQHAQQAAVVGARAQALPHLLGVGAVGGGIGEHAPFPRATHSSLPSLLQPRPQLFVDLPQMGDVGGGVGDLRRRQRPRRPVAEPVRLVDMPAGQRRRPARRSRPGRRSPATMAATWVSNSGLGTSPKRRTKISMSCAAAWKTFVHRRGRPAARRAGRDRCPGPGRRPPRPRGRRRAARRRARASRCVRA